MTEGRRRGLRRGAATVCSATVLASAVALAASSQEPPAPSPGESLVGVVGDLRERPSASPSATAEPVLYRAEDGEVITPGRIRRFLEPKGSPMAAHARDIVGAGVRHGVDPRVVVAIAGLESGFGAHAPGFNAWGWGDARWSSWPEAIDSYTERLAAGYRSLRTGRFHRASRHYCPPCGDRWGRVTAAIFRQI